MSFPRYSFDQIRIEAERVRQAKSKNPSLLPVDIDY